MVSPSTEPFEAAAVLSSPLSTFSSFQTNDVLQVSKELKQVAVPALIVLQLVVAVVLFKYIEHKVSNLYPKAPTSLQVFVVNKVHTAILGGFLCVPGTIASHLSIQSGSRLPMDAWLLFCAGPVFVAVDLYHCYRDADNMNWLYWLHHSCVFVVGYVAVNMDYPLLSNFTDMVLMIPAFWAIDQLSVMYRIETRSIEKAEFYRKWHVLLRLVPFLRLLKSFFNLMLFEAEGALSKTLYLIFGLVVIVIHFDVWMFSVRFDCKQYMARTTQNETHSFK